MDPVIVVGAGIAGISCAVSLHQAGVPVQVIDRGRKIGGRMASRRLEDRPTDLGAAFFTVSDPAFGVIVADWERRGLARPWTDSLTVLDAGVVPRTTTGPVRWGTPEGIRSVVEDLATNLVIKNDQVTVVGRSIDGTLEVDGQPAAGVVLAMPDPQARVLLGNGLRHEAQHLDMDYEPVLALAAWWPERTWDAAARPTADRFEGAFVNGDDDLSWVADDGRRRGDGAPVLVAHSTPGFATPHLVDPQAAGPAMVAAVRRVLGIATDPAGTYLQRWSVARPARVREAPYWLSPDNLGFCGDGWGPVSRVEGAYLSGRALGEALAARLA